MKALKIHGPKQIGLEEVKIPEIGPGDVLSRVKYCGICGTDVSIYNGDTNLVKNGLIKYPVIPGHEWSGIIEAVGKDVCDIKPGDRVVGDTVVSCGVCKPCLEGEYMQCEKLRCVGTVNAWNGGFADYTLFPSRHIYRIPDNVTLDSAALIEPAALGMHALCKCGFRPGQKVLVIGTGAIGLLATSLSSAGGASKVILAGRKDVKLETGRLMGADVLVNVTRDDMKEIVMQETLGRGVDIVIEASGSASSLAESLEMVRIGGTIALLGFYEQNIRELNIDRAVFNCIRILGIAGSPGMYIPTINLMASGKVDFRHVITHRYPFADVIKAFNDVKNKSESRIKILIEF